MHSPDLAPAADLPEYYARRLDAHLATLNNDHARRIFLAGMWVDWQYRARRFHESGGESVKTPHPIYGWPTAWDFAQTLSNIQVRMDRYPAVEKEPA